VDVEHPVITVRLLRNGYEVATATLANGVTSHTFTNLPKYNLSTGQIHTYTVVEDPVEGYTTAINGLTITGFVTGMGSIIQRRPCISRVIFPVRIYNRQFPHHVTPAESINFKACEFRGIGPNTENGTRQHVTDRVHYRVTICAERNLCHAGKGRGIGRSEYRLVSRLFDNTRQYGCNLFKIQRINCHLNHPF
jgi:hypothetical protein